ncbi:hypothetical protein [uncultured Modestobacter sp.]|uniref:hypothetical protein n=1 Tax=uncultured Modestobacter sp. TaxID=380048 RepID=UPI0026083D31|nr:hypothetical protein [uncultured Modestobacter sp.]
MSPRTDRLITGIGLVVAGVACLALLLAAGDATAPRVAGAALLVLAGASLVVSGRRMARTPAGKRSRSRDRTVLGLLFVLGAVEVVLWDIGRSDDPGQWGVATGFLVVGAVLVIAGTRRRRRS